MDVNRNVQDVLLLVQKGVTHYVQVVLLNVKTVALGHVLILV